MAKMLASFTKKSAADKKKVLEMHFKCRYGNTGHNAEIKTFLNLIAQINLKC